MLEPETDAPAEPRLIGIARLAANGEHIRDGHEVEFFTLEARSILNRCNVPRMPFSWTVNPYRGCEFACKYCYARYTHEFMELRDNVEFERKIFVKQHASELLRSDLRKVKAGEIIAIGTATDPYQPAERRYEVTRSVLEEFAKRSGYDIGIVTKSNLILRDTDVLRRVAERNSLYVNLTITTLDVDLARILEPRAPRPDLRLEAVRRLNENGVAAGVIIAPVLPSITDAPKALEAIVRATAEAGGRYVYANPLFLKPCSASIFLPFLRERFPHLVGEYEQRFRTNAFLPESYRKRISNLMAALRNKYGIVAREEFTAAAQTVKLQGESQLSLF
jgi:DNA repair photolyase